MGTHFYDPWVGRVEYGQYADDAKAAALANATLGLTDAGASAYVVMQGRLEGEGSMVEALAARYRHGLFWSVATGGLAFLGMFAFLTFLVTSSAGCASAPCAIYGDFQVCRPIMCVWSVDV